MILKIFTAWVVIVLIFFFIAWFVKRLTKKEALDFAKHTLTFFLLGSASAATLFFIVINY